MPFESHVIDRGSSAIIKQCDNKSTTQKRSTGDLKYQLLLNIISSVCILTYIFYYLRHIKLQSTVESLIKHLVVLFTDYKLKCELSCIYITLETFMRRISCSGVAVVVTCMDRWSNNDKIVTHS